MSKGKHLDLNDRMSIQTGLNTGNSFREIAAVIGKDPSTVSKEIRAHITIKNTSVNNSCEHADECTHYNDACRVCGYRHSKRCSKCSLCGESCPDFKEKTCRTLKSPPYVCNGCEARMRCHLPRHLYDAKTAQREYESTLRESREGIATSSEELQRIDEFISPLIKQGQSIHHICVNNADEIMLDGKTIYNYVDAGLFSARNVDLPRKVRYRRRKKKKTVHIDKKCHVGRTYEDFNAFIEANPDVNVVEMDSVEGRKGGKVLLTIYFRNCELMLAFLRDANTARSVTAIFNDLDQLLGREKFRELFPVILTDRGSEFTDPLSIEFDSSGERRTRVFYCDPQRSNQKGGCEVTHEMIRRILPKKTSFDELSQDDISLMMSHINSYARKKLGNRSPYQLFSSFYGDDLLSILNIEQIPFNDINLTQKLLNK